MRSRGQGSKRRKARPRKRANRAAVVAARHRHTDAGPDGIVCLHCGETYRAITATHLRAAHSYEGEHPVKEYKERFGLEVACCDEVRVTHTETRIETWRSKGQHWTKRRILRELRRHARAGRGAQSQIPIDLREACRREFGKHDDALRAAGLSPSKHRLIGHWSEERVVREIRDLSAAGKPLTATHVEAQNPALHGAATRYVSSWGAALRLAGFDPQEHIEPKVWNLSRAERWVDDRVAAGRCVRARSAPSGLQGCVKREAGLAWVPFVESRGAPYPSGKKRQDWTRSAVIAEIRELRRAGRALNREAVVKVDGQALTHQARKRFGSWDAALEAAGIDPRRVRLSRSWSKDDVIEAIQARHAAGKPMHYAASVADDRFLVNAAQRRFPSSWAKALKAAGLDPALARAAGPSRVRKRRKRGHK